MRVYICIGIANALWAAGSIGIPVQEQSETMAAAMWSSIAEALQGCSGWELTNIVWCVLLYIQIFALLLCIHLYVHMYLSYCIS